VESRKHNDPGSKPGKNQTRKSILNICKFKIYAYILQCRPVTVQNNYNETRQGFNEPFLQVTDATTDLKGATATVGII